MADQPQPVEAVVAAMKAAQQALGAWNQYGGNITHAQLMGQAQNCAISLDRMIAQVSSLSTRLAEAEQEIAAYGDLQNEHAHLMQAHREVEAKLVESEARERALREALQGLANTLEMPGARGVLHLVPDALVKARAALTQQMEKE